jgi:hypothetical protein
VFVEKPAENLLIYLKIKKYFWFFVLFILWFFLKLSFPNKNSLNEQKQHLSIESW